MKGKRRERQTSGSGQGLDKPFDRTPLTSELDCKEGYHFITASVWLSGYKMVVSNPCIFTKRHFLGLCKAVWMMLSNSREADAFSQETLAAGGHSTAHHVRVF